MTCGPGSPPSCQATIVTNAKGYSAGQVVRITNGLRVYKADQKNSCPTGYKIWSPRNKHDWIIMYSSLGQNIDNYPRNPNLIVDVTRPLDKCDGIEKISMKSTTAHQNWWKTSDGSSWWLRDSAFEQTCEDYRSNCYLDVYDVNPDNVQFNFGNCSFSSTDYLCQQKCESRTALAFNILFVYRDCPLRYCICSRRCPNISRILPRNFSSRI